MSVHSPFLPPPPPPPPPCRPSLLPTAKLKPTGAPPLSWGMWAHSIEDNAGGKSNQRGDPGRWEAHTVHHENEPRHLSWLIFFLPLFFATLTYLPLPTANASEQWWPCNQDDDDDATRIMTTTQQWWWQQWCNQDGDEGAVRTATMTQRTPRRKPRCNDSTATPRWNPTTKGRTRTGRVKWQPDGANHTRAGETTTGRATWQQGGRHNNQVGQTTRNGPWSNNTNRPTTTRTAQQWHEGPIDNANHPMTTRKAANCWAQRWVAPSMRIGEDLGPMRTRKGLPSRVVFSLHILLAGSMYLGKIYLISNFCVITKVQS